MDCRKGCGACCIAPSISSPVPGMPNGKPAGVPCIQLDEFRQCRLYGLPQRPVVCSSLCPEPSMCRSTPAEAYSYLAELELLTSGLPY